MYNKKILCFDLDNVICTTKGVNYKSSKPKKKIIKFINNLYDNGHEIKIFTARYMGRNSEKIFLAKKQGFAFTYKQLKNWNVKFDKLIFGKPTFDIYIDDKSYNFNKNWYKDLKKYLKLK